MTADETQANDSQANEPQPEQTGGETAEQTVQNVGHNADQNAETPANEEQPAAADAQAGDTEAAEATGEAKEAAPANQPKKPRVHPREVVKQFVAAWPKAFSNDPKQVKPLAIGILQQILAERPPELEGLNSKAIRAGMKFYTSRLSYHYAMQNASHRVDLKGEEAEPVDDKARKHAEEQIKAIHAARDAKRAEQGEGDEAGEKEGEKKPRRPRKAGGKPPQDRKGAKGAPRGQGDQGGKRRGEGRKPQGDKPKEAQADPALKNLSLEEKLDRLAQRFGQDGVK
ncbi:ProQ/FinO family protein [Guyparkeria sp. 1SP6A2]|nr:ProQ/FinO family protein [Guyparkeria sp. 1SP6A2]